LSKYPSALRVPLLPILLKMGHCWWLGAAKQARYAIVAKEPDEEAIRYKGGRRKTLWGKMT
jgi:hypothetical protein